MGTSIPKLSSTINQDFQLSNFIDLSEAEQYNTEQPIIKDIVLTFGDIAGALGDLYNTVMGLVNEFLSIFSGLKQFFDKLGLTDLFKSIFDFVSNNTSGFGFSLEQRTNLSDMYVNSCLNYNSYLNTSYGNKYNDLYSLTLVGILNALICLGTEGALTSLYAMLSDNTELDKTEVDNMVGSSLSYFMNESNPNSISLFEEIGTLGLEKSVSYYTPNITELGLKYIENDTSTNTDYNKLINSFQSYDNSFGTNTFDMSIFENTSKIGSLASSAISTREPSSDPYTVSDVSFDDMLSLF